MPAFARHRRHSSHIAVFHRTCGKVPADRAVAPRVRSFGNRIRGEQDGNIFQVGSGRDWTGEIPMDELIEANIIFAGNAEAAGDQIIDFSDQIGGIGIVLMMGHGGHLSHGEAMASIRLFGERVLPRLQHGRPPR